MTKYYYYDLPVNKACELLGKSKSMVMHRIKKGWDVVSAMEIPSSKNKDEITDIKAFIHTCPDCRFLGHHKDDNCDLYICNGNHGRKSGTWFIARYGNNPLHYSACRKGMAYNHVLSVAESLV